MKNGISRVVITGAESTGKSALSHHLAEIYNGIWIPEYAREYVENLNRPYLLEDVLAIARHQIAQESSTLEPISEGVIFFDTWLILTKVWLDIVYGYCPDWIIEHIRSSKIDLFLVCNNDIPWIEDKVRENGGAKREELFELYCIEIAAFGFTYEIISGVGPMRIKNALKALSKHGLNP